MKFKRLLTIAGSDSGGGAGVQADLKTFAAHAVYGSSVITALTAQNTQGVRSVEFMRPDFVAEQLVAVLDDIGTDGLKTGMLGQVSIIEAVAGLLPRNQGIPYVLDPVMVSKSGHRLLLPDAVEAVVERLFPLATLVTPNLDEVGEILGHVPTSVGEMKEAAEALAKRGAGAVLVKGGHLSGSRQVVDVLWDRGEVISFESPRQDTRSTHGTGCTLSAAIACNLALGFPMAEAVGRAHRWLQNAMLYAYPIGRGHGPLNHHWQQENLSPDFSARENPGHSSSGEA